MLEDLPPICQGINVDIKANHFLHFMCQLGVRPPSHLGPGRVHSAFLFFSSFAALRTQPSYLSVSAHMRPHLAICIHPHISQPFCFWTLMRWQVSLGDFIVQRRQHCRMGTEGRKCPLLYFISHISPHEGCCFFTLFWALCRFGNEAKTFTTFYSLCFERN